MHRNVDFIITQGAQKLLSVLHDIINWTRALFVKAIIFAKTAPILKLAF